MKIIETTEETLFGRKKITAEFVTDAATPSKEDIKKKIADSTKADVNLVVISKITTEFGARTGTILAYAYDSQEAMDNMERKTRKQRKAEAEEAKKAREEAGAQKSESDSASSKAKEEGAEAAPAEAPAEEKKEEPKAEEKEAPADKPEEKKE